MARRVAKGGKKAKKGFYVVELGDDEVDQVSSFEDHSDQRKAILAASESDKGCSSPKI